MTARALPILACLTMTLAPVHAAASTILRGQLADPVALNIGLICQWDEECIYDHKVAMRKALKYVAKYHPPQWRIEQCNRNASRGKSRVDWIGFNQCVRNAGLTYVPPAPKASRTPKAAKRSRRAHHN
jgi:hypothetical protein